MAGTGSGALWAAMKSGGSVAVDAVWSPRWTSKCRWGPLECPLEPTSPMTCPAVIDGSAAVALPMPLTEALAALVGTASRDAERSDQLVRAEVR
jgi:hypothetical protein